MLKSLFKKKEAPFTDLEILVVQAQKGDEHLRNQLLDDYKPFVSKCVSEVCKKYIDIQNNDEFSIGLIAFNEAIDKFSKDKGSSFLSFAKLVIKRRIIDYIRQESKHNVLTFGDSENENENYESHASTERFKVDSDMMQRQEEILHYSNKLKEFELSFSELATVTPKHKDSRDTAISIAKTVYENVELRTSLLAKKRLPIKELIDKVNVSKKTIERNRKYIIAIVIILSEDYVFLKDYLKGVNL